MRYSIAIAGVVFLVSLLGGCIPEYRQTRIVASIEIQNAEGRTLDVFVQEQDGDELRDLRIADGEIWDKHFNCPSTVDSLSEIRIARPRAGSAMNQEYRVIICEGNVCTQFSAKRRDCVEDEDGTCVITIHVPEDVRYSSMCNSNSTTLGQTKETPVIPAEDGATEANIDEATAVEIAKELVEANSEQTDQMIFKAARSREGWAVKAFRIIGHNDDGEPMCAVGGYRVIVIDHNGNVVSEILGR